ncbi:MAG TPA: hypothetical protein VMB72_15545 [Acidimicrobiales bacterium]|nr:hypothetical protein [Acidimicrobiales bacterium]
MQPARILGVLHAPAGAVGRRLTGLRPAALAALVVAGAGGGYVLAATAPAFAAASNVPITVTPDTGLTNGESVTVTGTGFDDTSPGNILQCNDAPNQPTVALPSPVSSSVSVSCNVIGYSHLVTTTATGALNATWNVIEGTVGPPCGTGGIITTCPTDSAGNSAAADAAKYPCPPTAAQQAAGDVCQLSYGDAGGAESASANILFQGESAPGATTTTAAPAATTTTRPATTATTTPPATTATTSPPATTATTAAPATAGSSSSSGTGSSLASTGPGPDLWVVGIVGFVALYLGAVVLALVDRPRNVLYRLVRRSGPAPAGPPGARPEFATATVGSVPVTSAAPAEPAAPAAPAAPTWAVPPDPPAVFYPSSSGPPGLWV